MNKNTSLRCSILGHKYEGGDKRTYNISVGKLGKITFTQEECIRCGNIITHATIDGDITVDNFIKACSTEVDKSIGNIIFPTDPGTSEGTLRKSRKSTQSSGTVTSDG